MKDYIKYGRARDQLYHLGVMFQQLISDIPAKRRTSELVQVLEIVESILDSSKVALENGQVMAVQIDLYEVQPLPGFEELMDDSNENPYKP